MSGSDQRRILVCSSHPAYGDVQRAVTVDADDSVDTLVQNFLVALKLSARCDVVVQHGDCRVIAPHLTVEEAGLEDGATIYLENLSETKTAGGNILHSWLCIAFVALLIGGGGISAIFTLFFLPAFLPGDFGVVIDCGSTHSELYVYSWAGRLVGSTTADKINEDMTCLANGSVTRGWGESLRPCLTKATASVPASRQRATPSFVAATAGMRLLRLADEKLADEILHSIEVEVKSFPFVSTLTDIISGQDEGMYGWSRMFYVATPTHRKRTYGALDMGGGSTQITFELLPSATPDSGDETDASSAPVVAAVSAPQLTLYGENYSLYGQSNDCYGIVEAERRYRAVLISDTDHVNQTNSTDGIVSIVDPCRPIGSSIVLPASKIFQPPCVENTANEIRFNENTNFMFWGSGDVFDCRNVVSKLVFVKKAPIPVETEFVAFSTFYMVADFFNISTNASLEHFNRTVDDFCSLTWPELLRRHGNETKFLAVFCFDGQYMLQLLTGYGFDEATFRRTRFQNKINGVEIGYALGLMLNATGQLPVDRPIQYIDRTIFYCLCVLFCSIVLIAAYFLTQQFRRTSTRRRMNKDVF